MSEPEKSDRNPAHALAEQCSAIATDNGFDKTTWATLPLKLVFALGELDEAVCFVYGSETDPLSEELADTTIRLLAVMHDLWGDAWTNRIPAHNTASWQRIVTAATAPHLKFRPIEVILRLAERRIYQAVEAWRHEHQDDVRGHLEYALYELWHISVTLHIDLAGAVSAKCTRNRSRPHLHGKARSEG